jgi:hypothetical protein
MQIFAMKPPSKKVQNYVKMKRLMQIKEEGKNYSSYIEEQVRYDILKNNTRNPALDTTELAAKVYKYKKELLQNHSKEVNEQVMNIGFLVDNGICESYRWFYDLLFSKSEVKAHEFQNRINITAIEMPNIYDFNTKRYESLWMNYMRELPWNDYETVIAHGSSAEAVLRYLENEAIETVILLDPPDIYTAGERHGRDFLYSRILSNVGQIAVLSFQNEDSMKAGMKVHNELKLKSKFFQIPIHSGLDVVNIDNSTMRNDGMLYRRDNQTDFLSIITTLHSTLGI